MSRPGPLPTAPDHELHDALLVAQYTAGDPLDPAAQREAEFFVSSCGACAALAADLRTVSGAVAWEPMPSRRRDFRITAARAEELRGNIFSRFMRRLALPQSAGLRPAAAGVMSLGLAFVVAGAVWPGSTVELASGEAGAEAPLATESATVELDLPAIDRDLASQEALGRDSDASFSGDSSFFTDSAEPAEAESGGAPAVLAAPDPNRKATGDEGTFERYEIETRLVDEESLGFRSDEIESVAGEPEMLRDAPDSVGLASGMSPEAGPEAVDDVAADALTDGQLAGTPLPAGIEQQDAATGGDDRLQQTVASSDPTEAGFDIETVLMVLGLALAAGGALMLVLVLLARRSSDPLVR